nr:proline-rich proteoglycan 2-like [Aegilops tauschii subsp. strangulata]
MYLTSGARMSTANLAYFFAQNPFVINLITQSRDLAGASSLARRSPVASTSPASPRRSPVAGSPELRAPLPAPTLLRPKRQRMGAPSTAPSPSPPALPEASPPNDETPPEDSSPELPPPLRLRGGMQ